MPRALGELGRSSPRSLATSSSADVPVVGEHLGVVLRAAERLDPLSDPAVLLDAVRARDLAVGDVADERVRERELGLALDR